MTRQPNRLLLILEAGIILFLPLLVCICACALQGHSLSEVTLLTCDWNDELFYYKQVEAILQYGAPQGYMGFNESHALTGSFAAWSPLLVWPWVLWGKCFGWNLFTPILCNIVLYGIALALFVLLAKPSLSGWLQMVGLFTVFSMNLRYMLSCMPEVICFAHLILFYGLALCYRRKERMWKLVLMFVLSILMTWMRPYLILTLLLPCFFLLRRNAKRLGIVRKIMGWFFCIGIFLITALGYYGINHYLAAPYFTDLFKTDWLVAFVEQGFGVGMKNVLYTLYDKGEIFVRNAIQGCIDGLWSGTFFAALILLMVLLLITVLRDVFAKGKKELPVMLHLLLSMVAMVVAMLLMYKINEGSKHLLTFVAAGILLLAVSEKDSLAKTLVMGALCIWLFLFHVIGGADFHITYTNDATEERAAYWQQCLAEGMEVTIPTPSYENTVVWVFSDDGVVTDWQELYMLPAGYGISCCYEEYVEENLSRLNSRYVATVTGGNIAKACEDEGYEVIGTDSRLTVYRRY